MLGSASLHVHKALSRARLAKMENGGGWRRTHSWWHLRARLWHRKCILNVASGVNNPLMLTCKRWRGTERAQGKEQLGNAFGFIYVSWRQQGQVQCARRGARSTLTSLREFRDGHQYDYTSDLSICISEHWEKLAMGIGTAHVCSLCSALIFRCDILTKLWFAGLSNYSNLTLSIYWNQPYKNDI